MKHWLQIFKSLSNAKRLEILIFLSNGEEKTVTEISTKIHVTLAGTSRHLRILSNLYILNEVGKNGHVYYSINPKMPTAARKVISLFIRI